MEHGLHQSISEPVRNISNEVEATRRARVVHVSNVDEICKLATRMQAEETREPVSRSQVCPKTISVAFEDVQATELVKAMDGRVCVTMDVVQRHQKGHHEDGSQAEDPREQAK